MDSNDLSESNVLSDNETKIFECQEHFMESTDSKFSGQLSEVVPSTLNNTPDDLEKEKGGQAIDDIRNQGVHSSRIIDEKYYANAPSSPIKNRTKPKDQERIQDIGRFIGLSRSPSDDHVDDSYFFQNNGYSLTDEDNIVHNNISQLDTTSEECPEISPLSSSSFLNGNSNVSRDNFVIDSRRSTPQSKFFDRNKNEPTIYTTNDDNQAYPMLVSPFENNDTGSKISARSQTQTQKMSSHEILSFGVTLNGNNEGTNSLPHIFLSLPNDSIHSIVSFISPSDLVSLSCANKSTRKLCDPIFKTVRMHGFRCAVEVVSTWLRGEHADARELAALYVNSGVPIYPPCYGHAYHTLTWRMSIEGREMESQNSPENESSLSDEMHRMQIDRFFRDRYDARDLSGYYIPSITYLEEKCLFWQHRDEQNMDDLRPIPNMSNGNSFFQAPYFAHVNHTALDRKFHSTVRSPSKDKNTIIRIHRHLANQHFAGNPIVEDDANGVSVGAISLSTNFFHPQKSQKFQRRRAPPLDSIMPTGDNQYPPRIRGSIDPIFVARVPHLDDPFINNRNDPFSREDPMFYPLPLTPPLMYTVPPSPSSSEPPSVLSDVTLEVYDSVSCLDLATKATIDMFQKKLEACVNTSSFDFSETLADFWDKFLPVTKGILFFDKHTPVPRQSAMLKFLTQPCPKAIGIVQCQIERIRSPPKTRKDVKGRFFPTYEYRLFIRDRRAESNPDHSTEKRADTVIMMAKNKGRYHSGISGGSGNTKRGVNNYFLYKASKKDVKEHKAYLEGTTLKEDDEDEFISIELGRLQSNFIGTEFQIFTPSEENSFSPNAVKTNECESDADIKSKQMNGITFKDHKKVSGKVENNTDNDQGNLAKGRKKSKKKKSFRYFRRSRRAIASLEDTTTQVEGPVKTEDEYGSITYTANLLGNRPRIMDVCIPKITEDGSETEWHRYVRNHGDDGEANRMLDKFKQLQERLNGTDRINEDPEPNAPSDFGLLALQNRPPWWNVELGAFVLNFGGRVSVASVKNFQLCDRNDQDHIMLQFGRIAGRHSFTMDFQHPLTAMQAFAIAISSLQSKISLG